MKLLKIAQIRILLDYNFISKSIKNLIPTSIKDGIYLKIRIKQSARDQIQKIM